jgi:hypothetical protein
MDDFFGSGQSNSSSSSHKSRKKPPFWAVLVTPFLILVLIGAGAAGYFYYQYQKAQKEIQTIRTDPNAAQKATLEETKRLISEISKLIDLPSDEEPTVATITDVAKLKDQPFFAKAKNGDKVLIYPNAKKAILYDPTTHKILDVAPVNIGTPSAQLATPTPSVNDTPYLRSSPQPSPSPLSSANP